MLDRPTHSTGGPHGGVSFARSHSRQVRISVNVRDFRATVRHVVWSMAACRFHSYTLFIPRMRSCGPWSDWIVELHGERGKRSET